MILGRSVTQWAGLITALFGTIQTIGVVILPSEQAALLAVILGATSGFLGVLIAFIANTPVTPVAKPEVPAGTNVTILPTPTSAPGTAPQVVTLPEPGVPQVLETPPA